MRARFFIILSLLGVVLSVPPGVFSQTESADVIGQLIESYRGLRYEETELLARRVLVNRDRFTSNQLAIIHQYLAFSLVALGRIDEARSAFKAALQSNPGLTLDPALVSPKIIAVFDKVKTEFQAKLQAETQDKEISPGVIYKSPVTWRSLAFPGWEQLHRGEKKKGWALLSAGAASTGGLIFAHVQTRKTRQDYMKATETPDVSEQYKRYNNYYKARYYFFWATLGVWLYSYLDALFRPPSPEVSTQERSFPLTPQIKDDTFLISFLLKF
ncbi:MAG: hypothetical protein ACE5OR_10075 [bacterium]